MNGTAFDGISRDLGQRSTRRGFLRLLGGAAAVGAVATVGLGGKSQAKKKKPGKVTICYQGQIQRVSKRGWQNQYPGATLGECKAQPAVCTSWIISGGPDRTTPIGVDDDLKITVNGANVVNDANKMAGNIPAAPFTANVGDQIAVTAFDDNPACRSISPLWLHCATTGQKKQLSAGQNDGCVPAGTRTPSTFFSQVFTVGL